MMLNASSGEMLDQGRQSLSGDDGLGATAITGRGIYVISKASSGAMAITVGGVCEQILLSSHKLQ
eukprot:3678059-Rhodomonas_salina.1